MLRIWKCSRLYGDGNITQGDGRCQIFLPSTLKYYLYHTLIVFEIMVVVANQEALNSWGHWIYQIYQQIIYFYFQISLLLSWMFIFFLFFLLLCKCIQFLSFSKAPPPEQGFLGELLMLLTRWSKTIMYIVCFHTYMIFCVMDTLFLVEMWHLSIG